jgi:hypothetical protein
MTRKRPSSDWWNTPPYINKITLVIAILQLLGFAVLAAGVIYERLTFVLPPHLSH